MNTREIASAYRLSQWAQKLQERTARGESIPDFCERTGVSRNTFFYWQRKLRAAACEALLPQAPSEEGPQVPTVQPGGWALCEEASVELEQADDAVIIEIGKCRLRVDGATSPELLEKACRVLMSLC